MAVRGRKPKPTAIKVLEGNPGKRPLNELEPIPPKVDLKCPSWILPEAKKEWKRLAPSWCFSFHSTFGCSTPESRRMTGIHYVQGGQPCGISISNFKLKEEDTRCPDFQHKKIANTGYLLTKEL